MKLYSSCEVISILGYHYGFPSVYFNGYKVMGSMHVISQCVHLAHEAYARSTTLLSVHYVVLVTEM